MNRLHIILIALLCTGIAASAQSAQTQSQQSTQPQEPETVQTMRRGEDGSILIDTRDIGRDLVGYGGPVPVEICLADGKVVSVRLLANKETPAYVNVVVGEGLLESWNGLTPAEALELEVDAVTGATRSSRSIIYNVRTGLKYAQKNLE